MNLSREEYRRLAWEEYAYDTVEVPVEIYAEDGGDVQFVLAFRTAACAVARPDALPSMRWFVNVDGAARAASPL